MVLVVVSRTVPVGLQRAAELHRRVRDVGIADLSEEEIVAEVDKGCRQVLLNADAPPPKILGVKLWPTAIPQYELGHLPLIEQLEKAEAETPGLYA